MPIPKPPIEHPLESLGAHMGLLTKEEAKILDTQGYLSLGQLIPTDQLDTLRNRIQELVAIEGDNGGSELFRSKHIRHAKEEGVERLADLPNKGSVFDILYTHPRLLAAVRHVLGSEIRLSSLNYRAAKPGQGLQKLHVDWKEAVEPDDFRVCNSIWLLDDFSIANGATRLVPQSHLRAKLPSDEMSDPLAPHPDEVILEAPAGTVTIFNSHVWHGGTTNHTQSPRRAIHSYFCRRDQPQQSPQQELIRSETLERISDGARWLLDVR